MTNLDIKSSKDNERDELKRTKQALEVAHKRIKRQKWTIRLCFLILTVIAYFGALQALTFAFTKMFVPEIEPLHIVHTVKEVKAETAPSLDQGPQQ